MDRYVALKEKFNNRDKISGTTMSMLNHTLILEKMNIPDLDFVLFDAEHGGC